MLVIIQALDDSMQDNNYETYLSQLVIKVAL